LSKNFLLCIFRLTPRKARRAKAGLGDWCKNIIDMWLLWFWLLLWWLWFLQFHNCYSKYIIVVILFSKKLLVLPDCFGYYISFKDCWI
jgi:hypothetical protein